MLVKTDQKIDIAKVWELFHKTGEDQYRNLLLENYRHIVRYAAERLHAKLPGKVELDDLISAGIFGLMDAIDAYDPERGVKFETYCSPRIRGSILDELRSMDWVPRLVRARAHQLTNATRTLQAHLGRMPTDEETAGELKLGKTEFQRLQRDANAIGLISLNNKYTDDDGDKEIREVDIVRDEKSKDPLIEAQKRYSWGLVGDIGVRINNKTDAGLEVAWIPSETRGGTPFRATFLLGIVQFRPWESQGFFVKGGMGMAFTRNFLIEEEDPITQKALAVDIGGGWAFRPDKRVGFQLHATLHVAALGDFATGEEVVENVMGNFWSLGGAVVIR